MSAFHDEIKRRYKSPEKFVDDMKSKMALHKIPQTKLARRSGHSRANVCRWVNRRQNPSLKSMIQLDEAIETIIEEGRVLFKKTLGDDGHKGSS